MAKFMLQNGIDCAPYLDDIVDTAANILDILVLPCCRTLLKDHALVAGLLHADPARYSSRSSDIYSRPQGDDLICSRPSERSSALVRRFSARQRLAIGLLRLCNYRIGKSVYVGASLIVVDDLSDNKCNLLIGDRAAISPGSLSFCTRSRMRRGLFPM